MELSELSDRVGALTKKTWLTALEGEDAWHTVEKDVRSQPSALYSINNPSGWSDFPQCLACIGSDSKVVSRSVSGYPRP